MENGTERTFVGGSQEPAHGGLPWLLTLGALFTGVALARAIDWRAHAHPRL